MYTPCILPTVPSCSFFVQILSACPHPHLTDWPTGIDQVVQSQISLTLSGEGCQILLPGAPAALELIKQTHITLELLHAVQ